MSDRILGLIEGRFVIEPAACDIWETPGLYRTINEVGAHFLHVVSDRGAIVANTVRLEEAQQIADTLLSPAEKERLMADG